MTARTVKLVRLRDGVYATGKVVGAGHQPHRVIHAVDIAADLDASDGVTAFCRAEFVAGTLVEVAGQEVLPHKHCQRRLQAAGIVTEGGAVDG
jgi:hypothetical protein